MPNHYSGDLLHTIAISGFSRVRTDLKCGSRIEPNQVKRVILSGWVQKAVVRPPRRCRFRRPLELSQGR